MQRATSPSLDDLIANDTFFNVLDHGLIRVIDYMGTDQSIVDAARISYGKGTTLKSDDKGLINYLMRHHHTTPFEMCEIKLYIKCPIFVARQWMRHRTASINEYSARYSEVNDDLYIPKSDHVKAQHASNRQMSGVALSDVEIDCFLDDLESGCKRQYTDYKIALNNGNGVSRETARIGLTLNTYTEFVWKIDLHNLLHFLMLRMDLHAQYEIRVYADAIAEIIKAWCPLAYEAFEKYRLNSVTFSEYEFKEITDFLYCKGFKDYHDCNIKNMSKGENKEFKDKLKCIFNNREEDTKDLFNG